MIFVAFVYNEQRRIRQVLDHATQWATEVVLLDKGSTDGTLEICRSYGDRVRVVSIPFSERGHEDPREIPRHVTGEWIFFGTCSEIPTRPLIEKCRELIEARGADLDLIYVPRLMYFFGINRAPENGGVAYFPCLFHKDRVVITNEIHDNYHARDAARTARIAYAKDCCVHHMTHPTMRSFWLSSLDYFAAETAKEEAPEKIIRDCFKNVQKLSQRMLLEGDAWLPFYCALTSYEMGKALAVWEKAQGPNAGSQKYEELAQHLMAQEWKQTASTTSAHTATGSRLNLAPLKRLMLPLAAFPYILVKFWIALRVKLGKR